eukprot:TRINITY_DN986_c0_g1_i1.p1 TRINITY_DN986_c0_g1~~TRINITY_DN986_c0_g1_i1.p1  ORF type:complete len:246 (+),score=73.83 TRINITY_DN986_c0_g1_i1:52-738(+)
MLQVSKKRSFSSMELSPSFSSPHCSPLRIDFANHGAKRARLDPSLSSSSSSSHSTSTSPSLSLPLPSALFGNERTHARPSHTHSHSHSPSQQSPAPTQQQQQHQGGRHPHQQHQSHPLQQQQSETEHLDLSTVDLSRLPEEDRKLLEWMPKPRRSKYLRRGRKAKMFTGDDLIYVVTNALRYQKNLDEIKTGQVLQEGLKNQFQSFSRYMQDTLHQRDKNVPLPDYYT